MDMAEAAPIQRLLAIMARLRNKDHGCPWDRAQNFASIAPYTIEEAYEVADAIERGDLDALREELGDLLLQVVFHARMAEEDGRFDFHDVATAIADKLVRRHPNVFADAPVADAAAQTRSWEAMKAEERAAKSRAELGALDGVASGLPALARAQKIQARAARVGFDWAEPLPALAKVEEEIRELRTELQHGARDPSRLSEELGDLLFAQVNVARLAGLDAEAALRRATRKFERRFSRIEALLAVRGKTPAGSTLAEMDALWERVKQEERDQSR
jgi:nucleoside triphosphate diphosphatase